MNIKTRNTLTVFFTLLIVGLGIFLLIKPIEDDTDMTNVKIPQFEEVSSTNDDLEDLNSFGNLVKFNDKYWFGSGGSNVLYAKSVSSLTDTTTTEKTSTNTDVGINFIPTSHIVKVLNNKLYVAHTVYDSDDLGLTDPSGKLYVQIYDGSSWTSYSKDMSALIYYDEIRVLDLFYANSSVWAYVADYVLNGGAYVYSTRFIKFTDSSVNGILYLGSSDQSYRGYLSGTKYYYIPAVTYGKVFDASTATNSDYTDVNTLYGAGSYNDDNAQLLWKQKNVEIMMNPKYLYTRVGSGDWQEITDTGTATNAVIWKLNSDNELEIAYIVWKDAIYEVLPGGGLGKIQIFYDDAYVGWEDWFANGSDKIYQISYTGTRYGHTMNIREVHIKELSGEAEMTDGTDDAPITVDWGTWYDPDLSDWTDSSGTDCEVSIIKEIGGHKNVMQLYDNNASARIDIKKTFTAQTNGFIEFMLEGSDTALIGQIILLSSSTGAVNLAIGVTDDKLQYYDGSWHDIISVADDIFYHIRITFECGSDAYDGLSADHFNIYINGSEKGPYPFQNAVTGIDTIQLLTNSSDSGYYYYVDLIGISGNGYIAYSNYRRMWEKGDLIPIYDPNDELVFKGFVESIIDGDYHTRKVNLVAPWKLDLTKKITYSISASAPDTFFPAIASANFEFSTFDVASGGNNYTRDWKNTELLPKIKEVIKRENWVWYAGPDQIIHLDDGTERAIIDYKRGTGTLTWGTSINPDLSDWNTGLNGADATLEVKDIVDSHKNILNLTRTAGGGAGRVYYTFTAQEDGTFDVFIATTDISKNNFIYVLNSGSSLGGGNIAFYFGFIASQIRCYYGNGAGGSTYTVLEAAPSNNTIYTIKISFDCDTDKVSCWYEGTLKVNNQNFFNDNTFDTLSNITLYTLTAADYSFYVDALGFSWDLYKTYRTLYPFCRSVGAKITKITPKNSRLSVSKAIVTGKIVNGIPTEGSYTNNEVRFGKIVRDSIPDEESKSVLDLIAQALVINRDTEFLQVVCTVYSMSPVRWGRQIYFDYPERRDKFTDLGAPALYYVNKSETWVVGGYQKLSISDSLIFPSEKKRVREGTGIKEVDTGGINPENNDRRIQDVESKTTWTWRDPIDFDFDETNLTDDTNWNDLDLSSIVGSAKKLVLMRITAKDTTIDQTISIKRTANSNDYAIFQLRNNVANIYSSIHPTVETDSDGKIKIKCSAKPTDWDNIYIVIMGYRDA